MTEAFEFLESMVEAGKIKNYGMSTYSCLRVKPAELKMHLNLQKVHRLAQKVVGEDKSHHFNYVQVPINVMMPEAFVEPFQKVENERGVTENKILVAACSDLEINLVASQPLMQGMATQIPLSRHAIDDVYNISARHLQLIRSIPTRSLVSAVVGMKKMDNVRQNLEVIKKPLLTRQEFMEGIKPIKRSEFVEEELDI